MDGTMYPRIKNGMLLCLLCLGIQLGLGFLAGVLYGALKMSGDSLFAVLMSLCSMVSIGTVSFIGFKKTKRKFNEVFKCNRVAPFLWVAATIFMMGFVMVISELDNILNAMLPMPEVFKDIFETLLAEQLFAVALIVIAILPACTEELFFRGLILDGFTRNYTRRKAIVWSALFFGIIHLNPWQFLGGFILGLFSAWVCINTNSIWLSIYMHFFNNALYAAAIRFTNLMPIPGFNANYAIPVVFQPLWFDLTGLALVIIGILLLKKGFRENAENSAHEAVA